MTIVADAPQTGGEEAVSAPAAAPEKSTRDLLSAAFEQVEAREATETDKAARVLREGAGADDKPETDETGEPSEASERAKKGWETRRANAEAEAAEKAKPAEKTDTKAAAPADDKAKPEEAKPEPAKSAIPAPSRLSKEAQAEWDKTPEPVRAEAVRAISELEKGLAKHKEGAERWTKLEPFEKMAKESYGVPLDDVLKNYIAIDQGLAKDPLKTIDDMILKPMGYTLRQVAEHVLGQEAPEGGQELAELRRELAEAKGEIKRINSTFEQQRESERRGQLSTVEKSIESFASAHPRYAELEPTIIKILNSPLVDRSGDPVADLRAAYETAERLNPAPVVSPPAPAIPAPDPAVQTRRGSLSLSGAPSAGSDPAVMKPIPKTAGDSVRSAARQLGLSVT